MNTKEKEMDCLTRSLMKDTIEQPSASLNSRIMALIMKEKALMCKYHMKRLPPVSVLFALFVGYMLLIAGIAFLVKSAGESGMESSLAALMKYFPLLLTVGAGVSFCYLFAELDHWLRVNHPAKKGR